MNRLSQLSSESLAKIFTLLLLLSTCGARLESAEPEKTGPVPLHFITKWNVSYSDSNLGEIKGVAYVNWDNHSARVVVRDSKTNSERNLVASDVKSNETDDVVAMTLRGEGFSDDTVTAPSIPGAKKIAAAPLTKIAIGGSFGEKEIQVENKARPDSGLTRLLLRRGPFCVLSGEWSYYADPVTQRDGSGKGRVGWFQLLNKEELEQYHANAGSVDGGFVGRQMGREQWWPIPVEIAAVEVVENQLISDEKGPIYPAPEHEKNPYYVFGPDVTKWHSETAKHRTLFVAGRNFTTSGDESERLVVEGAGYVEPKLVARSKDPNLSEDLKRKFDIGWTQMARDSTKEKRVTSSDLDAELWEITLNDIARAGPKKCTYRGQTREWLLQYGNNRAEARFVRPLKEAQASEATSINELEASQTFYVPERVAVEVQTRLELPFDHLQVRVGTNRSSDALKVVSAQRVSPGLYRTGFFKIGAADLPAKEGDELLATVDQRDLLDNYNFQFVGGVLAKARLSRTPGSREQGKSGGLWKDALLSAAKLAGKQNLSLAKLAEAPAEEIHDINVTVGDHAAMLLLREAFVDKMKTQLDWLNGLEKDEDLQKFRDWIEPYLSGDNNAYYAEPEGPKYASADPALKYPSWLSFLPQKDKKELFETLEGLNEGVETLLNLPVSAVQGAGIAASVLIMGVDDATGGRLRKYATRWGRGSTLARIAVTGADGSPAPFYEAFDRYDNPTANVFKTEVERRRWQLDATKEAIKKYRGIVEESKTYAEKIDPSDREELLKLTGIGFGAVIYDLLPRLMRLETSYVFEHGGKKLALNEDEFGEWKKNNPNDAGKVQIQYSMLWVPDTTARDAVCNLAITHKAIRAQKDVSNVKYQMAARGVMVILGASAAAGEGALAKVVSLAGNTLMWAIPSLQAITDTYKSRQDVQFELGYAIVLGKERLAQAEAKKQEWFSTIASVVANGALIVLDGWSQAQKEMAVYRGRKICDAKQMRGDLDWFRGLNKDEAADVMAYFDRADLRNYTASPMARGDAIKLYQAERAGHEARAPPEPKKVAGAAEAEAKPGFREAQTEVEGQSKPGFREAQTEAFTNPPEKAPAAGEVLPQTVLEDPPPPGLPTALLSGIEYGEEIPMVRDLPRTGAPAENSWWYAGISKDGDPVHYKLGKRLGKGASSEVYIIEDVSGRPKFQKPVVIKFVRDDIKKAIAGQVLKDGKRIDTVWTKGVFGTAKEQIKRMLFSEEQLTKAKIKHAKILESHPELETPIVIQEKVELDGKNCLQIDAKKLMTKENLLGKEAWVPKSYAEVCALFPPEMQHAVPKFYRQLADAGLASTDMSLANIYFEKVGGEWVCGVLDVDHIVPYGQETGHMTTWWISKNEEILAILGDKGKEVLNAGDFMEAMGTMKMGGNYQHPFMYYDGIKKEIRAILIDPAIWEKYFPDLKKGIPKPAAPKKPGASARPVRSRTQYPTGRPPECDSLELALAA